MNKDNSKVPIAVLSCFLIAFILQGILKLCGVFIFEKALDWEIFVLIDNSFILQVIYYSIIMILTVYFLSFSLTLKPYTKKWYHFIIIIISCILVNILRLKILTPYEVDIILDIAIYIVIPFVINITTNSENKLFKNDLFSIIITLSLQISFYFCYLGITYWSSLLNSLVIESTILLPASTHFLVFFEIYIGLATFMIGMNMFIAKIKRSMNMIRPTNIASDEAKEKELEELENKGK